MKHLFLILSIISPLFLHAQDKIDNAAIIQLSSLQLSDDIIAQKIKTSECHFNTSVDSIISLKQKGVSNAIISLMMTGKDAPKAVEQPKQMQHNAGLFIEEGDALLQIIPSAFSASSADATGLLSAKGEIKILGKHSYNDISNSQPIFHFFFDYSGKDIRNWQFKASTSPYEFALVYLEEDDGFRKIRTSKAGPFRYESGVDISTVIPVVVKQISQSHYTVTPVEPLVKGEYTFMYNGSIPSGYTSNTTFDFSYRTHSARRPLYPIGAYVWVLTSFTPVEGIVTECQHSYNDIVYTVQFQTGSWRLYSEYKLFPTKEAARQSKKIKLNDVLEENHRLNMELNEMQKELELLKVCNKENK